MEFRLDYCNALQIVNMRSGVRADILWRRINTHCNHLKAHF